MDLAVINARPGLLADVDLSRLRHYVHVLLRSERWADGWGSPVLDAVLSGALGLVAQRLEKDGRLRDRA